MLNPRKHQQIKKKTPTKLSEERKKDKLIDRRIAIIAVLIAMVPIAYTAITSIPSPNLQVNVLSGLNTTLTYNQNFSIITGIDITIPTIILNTGNTPIHISACDIYLNNNGRPENITQQTLGAILDLKPQDSARYNFTKHFQVSLPSLTSNQVTYQDALKMSSGYFLCVMYYTQDVRNPLYYWVDITQYVKSFG